MQTSWQTEVGLEVPSQWLYQRHTQFLREQTDSLKNNYFESYSFLWYYLGEFVQFTCTNSSGVESKCHTGCSVTYWQKRCQLRFINCQVWWHWSLEAFIFLRVSLTGLASCTSRQSRGNCRRTGRNNLELISGKIWIFPIEQNYLNLYI